MKRLFALALILALAAGLCACGETTVIENVVEKTVEVPVVPEAYIRHKAVLDALNADDYDTARAIIELSMPQPEKPEAVEVEITTENFLDYFEYIEMPEYNLQIERLSSGEPAAIFAQPGYFLKEEYQLDPDRLGDNSVTAEVKYKYWIVDGSSLTIDFENASYELDHTLDASIDTLEVKTETMEAYYTTPWLHLCGRFREAILNEYVNYAATVVSPYELISASGTLYLRG